MRYAFDRPEVGDLPRLDVRGNLVDLAVGVVIGVSRGAGPSTSITRNPLVLA